MPKLGLISLGCAKNLVDSEHMLSLMRDAGWEITEDMSEADVGVVNTCGFIEAAKTEAIETILETAQYKQTGSMKGLVVTGCLVQRYADEMRSELPEIDVLCGTGSYDNIVDAANAALKGQQAAYMADMTAAALDGGRSRLTPSYTAYFKIAEGCSNTCAYCIIPKLRGRYRSREMASLLEEARALSDAGVKELIVIAQDITKYGMDLPEHKRLLPELLRELCKMDFTWIRLHYLYPDQITDELIDVIAEEPKIVKYLDIPLQHVSKRILRAMHRPGDGAEAADGTVPRLNGQHACLRNGNGCKLVDRRGCAVVIDHDLIEHSRICAACADGGVVAFESRDGFAHFAFCFCQYFLHKYILLSVISLYVLCALYQGAQGFSPKKL